MRPNIKRILLSSGFIIFVSLLFFIVSTEIVQAGWAADVKNYLTKGLLEDIGNSVLKLGAVTIAIGAWAMEFFLWIIFELVVKLVQDLFKPEYYQNTLNGFAVNPMVINGWKVVAAFCNMLYIIVLLFIGVGTLFRIEKYNYKKLLIKLIVVALLTNFSLVFAGIVLDFFHILMFNGIFGDPLEKIEIAVKNLLWGPFNRRWETFKGILFAPDMATIAGIVAGSIGQLIFMAMVSIVILAVGIFLIIRTVALWVLLVLSPIAYIGLVLPDTEGTAKKWWSSFLKYAIAGPILFFFLWFSAEMMNLINTELVFSNPQNDLTHMDLENGKTLGDKAYMDPIVASHNTYMYMMFSSILLWGSIIAAASLSIAGASKITRMAQVAVIGGAVMAHKIGLHGTKNILGGVGKRLQQVTPSGALHSNASLWEKTKASFRDAAPGLGKGLVGVGGAAKALAVLEPITLARSAYGAYKKKMDAQGKEDIESVGRIGSFAWLAMTNQPRRVLGMTPATQMAGDAVDKSRTAARTKNGNERNEINNEDQGLRTEESALNSEENSLNNEEAGLIMGGAGERRKEEIEARKNEIANKRNEIGDRRNELQEKKGGLIKEWNTDNLDQSHDDEYRKAAKREVYGKKWRSYLYDDRVHAQKVAVATERKAQEEKNPDQKTAGLAAATNNVDREAGLRDMAKRDMNITDELRNNGLIDSTATLNDFIDKHFKGNYERAGGILKVDLDNIARENKRYSETGGTIMDSKTKQMRSATKEEQVQNIDKMLSNLGPRKYVDAFKTNLIVKIMPDGTRKLADTAHVAIKNMMTPGFVETVSRKKTTSLKEIKELKKMVQDTRITNELNENEIKKIKEVIDATEKRSNVIEFEDSVS